MKAKSFLSYLPHKNNRTIIFITVRLINLIFLYARLKSYFSDNEENKFDQRSNFLTSDKKLTKTVACSAEKLF